MTKITKTRKRFTKKNVAHKVLLCYKMLFENFKSQMAK